MPFIVIRGALGQRPVRMCPRGRVGHGGAGWQAVVIWQGQDGGESGGRSNEASKPERKVGKKLLIFRKYNLCYTGAGLTIVYESIWSIVCVGIVVICRGNVQNSWLGTRVSTLCCTQGTSLSSKIALLTSLEMNSYTSDFLFSYKYIKSTKATWSTFPELFLNFKDERWLKFWLKRIKVAGWGKQTTACASSKIKKIKCIKTIMSLWMSSQRTHPWNSLCIWECMSFLCVLL